MTATDSGLGAPRDGRSLEASRLARLIATSFVDLDATRYLVPEPDQRVAVMTRDFVIFVDHALTTGTVHVVDDPAGAPAGVAIWAASDDTGPDGYDKLVRDAVGAQRVDRFTLFDELLHGPTPPTPHAYLAFLAVAPNRQNNGVGSALLSHGLAVLPPGMPTFLVASNQRAAGLYRRHGYRQLGAEVVLPNGGRMPPMWRPAR